MTLIINYRQVSIAVEVSDVKWTRILGAIDLGPREVAYSEEVWPQPATGDLPKEVVGYPT